MICPKCRKRIEDDSIICYYCGERISTYTSENSTVDNKRKKRSRGALRTFLLIVAWMLMIPAFFINTITVLTIGGTTVFAIGVLLYAISRYLKHISINKYPIDDTARLIAKRLAHEQNETVRLIAKKVHVARIVLTLCFAVVLFYTLDLLYYQYFLIPVLAVFLLVYETLFLKFNTFSILYKEAKKNPDLTVADVVFEETYNEVDSPQIVKSVLVCITAVLIAIGSFVYFNVESKFSVEDIDGGVCITKYEPGIFQLQKAVEIPKEINGKPVVAISEEAFAWNIYVQSISMPDTVKTIGESAFYDCRSLTKIELSSKVTKIGESAFESCYSLKKVDLPSALKKMGCDIFNDCSSLRSINIPEGITVIPEGAFDGCTKLEIVDWHEGIKEIQSYVFRDCDTITEAGFPEGITEIADHLFEDCDKLQTVYIPRGVKKIGAYAFDSCESLSYVFVPDEVTKIEKHAFDNCESLNEIHLPKDVSIHDEAFDREITAIKQKNFTDETSEKIDKEFENITIERIYVIYDKGQGKDKIYSPKNNQSITVSHTERLREKLADNMDLLIIETPTEFMEYLKKARDAGIVNVLMGFDSQVAAEAAGKPYFVSYNFDIESLIQSYEENPNEF